MNNENSAEDKLKQAYRELNMLYEVSAAMRSTLELEHILYIILTGVTSHSGLGYNRAILFLVNPKNQTLECEMAIGPESGEHANKIWNFIEKSKTNLDDLIQEEQVETTIAHSSLFKKLKALKFHLNPEEKSLLADAFRRGTPWHLTPDEVAHYQHDPLLQNFQTHELLIMPLRAKGTINGMIVADNIYTQKPITDDDIRIFSLLAGQAGLAIENSRLYELTVQMGQTDALTKLWNHGYFQRKLKEELLQAFKDNRPLSLMMIDIDNFKTLNDTHGHQLGDFILFEIAELLRQSSRETDSICRYGGEEFAVILHNTGQEQSLEIAERVRLKIQDHPFTPPGMTQNLKITVSIGLSTFPKDAQTKEELIANADRAMYIAKFSGKNKSHLASSI